MALYNALVTRPRELPGVNKTPDSRGGAGRRGSLNHGGRVLNRIEI